MRGISLRTCSRVGAGRITMESRLTSIALAPPVVDTGRGTMMVRPWSSKMGTREVSTRVESGIWEFRDAGTKERRRAPIKRLGLYVSRFITVYSFRSWKRKYHVGVLFSRGRIFPTN